MQPEFEIARLRAKLAEITDPDIRVALEEKIATLTQELAKQFPVETPATASVETKPERPRVVLEPAEEARLRQKLAELQGRADRTDDEDVREALNREVLRINLLLSGHEFPEEPTEAPMPASTASREQIERAESLIREARVERMRSNNAKADALMKKAAEAAPNSTEVFSALGDEMVERKQWSKARDLYQQALALKPKDPVLERKLGDLVLRLGPARTIEQQLQIGLSDSPFLTEADSVANAKTATAMSFFCPGLGHLVMGKTWQGVSMFVAWAAMIIWIVIRKDDLKELLFVAGIGKGQGSGSMVVLIPIFVALVIHISAVASCASRAKRGGGKIKIDRPTPPMNLPFE